MAEGSPTPRLASSVILLRRGGKHADRALEVCLARRNPHARFMPDVWVFPGGAIDPEDGEGEPGHRTCAARELAEEVGIDVAPADLMPYSRWITPEMVPIRFDTYFYLALAPAHTPLKPDGEETVEAEWFEPASALERHGADNLKLVFPTIKHLESLLPFKTAGAAIEAVRGRKIEPIMPTVVGEGDDARIVLPAGLGFD